MMFWAILNLFKKKEFECAITPFIVRTTSGDLVIEQLDDRVLVYDYYTRKLKRGYCMYGLSRKDQGSQDQIAARLMKNFDLIVTEIRYELTGMPTLCVVTKTNV